MALETGIGNSFPLGSRIMGDGVNFSVYSRNALEVQLLLFDHTEAAEPSHVIRLDARRHRTYHYWHIHVKGIGAGQLYGWRVIGPFAPERGLRFDPGKVLLDPYARAVETPRSYSRWHACLSGDNTASCLKSVVVDLRDYGWEEDKHPRTPYWRTVIYELHVRGFTIHESSGVESAKRGTYAGLIEKIPYLKELGVTAVELLPVFQFDADDAPKGLKNYWGYSPLSFFAPHAAYSSRRNPDGPIREFRDMVKALHRAGLEVILDVVFNHTAEGSELGPTLCFKGLENSAYYILSEDRRSYANYSGTGNTLNANHPIVRRMIVDSLKYWVSDMHVDGFRFDLASILSRDETGKPIQDPPVLWDIESDPVLAGTKLIAEAWDAGGLYQVGGFVGDSWKEWNGQFRDDVRRFVKGDNDTVGRVASRLVGSPDLFAHEEREPEQSVNFVTCHDGFTLADLVSYNRKHNELNGENNQDGTNDNHSWNCGVEGPTQEPQVHALRLQQMKNLIALNLFAVGTPMLLMGDEMARTQNGNNNAYAQDNPTSWMDWSLLERNKGLFRFVQELVRLRRDENGHDVRENQSLNQLLKSSRIVWHGVKLHKPDWGEQSHSLACSGLAPHGRGSFHMMMNAWWKDLVFEVPDVVGGWRRWVDTALPSPQDIVPLAQAPAYDKRTYLVRARSLAVLWMDAVPAPR